MVNGHPPRSHRVRTGTRALAVALAAAVMGTMAAGPAHAAPPPPPPPATGSAAHPQQPPSYMNQGIRFWEEMGWPNWRNIGNGWFTASSQVDSHGNRIREIVYTGGQFQDRDGRLRSFLNSGAAGSSNQHYQGTFQEYNITVYHHQENTAIPRRDANRVVRAVATGALFWTNDHYSTFHYMGQH